MSIQKLILILLPALLTGCGMQEKKEIAEAPVTEDIRLNQVGYYPDLSKQFTLAASTGDTLTGESTPGPGNASFSIINLDDKVVFRGELKDHGTWEPSGGTVLTGDFSALKKEGTYRIYVPGTGKSYTFEITEHLYDSAAIDALKSYYFMRTGVEISEEYVGKFARPGGHPDDTVYFHPSSGRSEGFTSSPGGWYDAGDYGKYIINAGISAGTMLALYEWMPGTYPDGSLDIPESGNGISDLLDELKFEYEWVLTMQDTDGGVFHKLTSLRHDGITMPRNTHSKRFMIGKSTAASLDFAAMLAQASRVYSEVDAEFAARCLLAAVRAWEWALDNPEIYFRNPEGINTGGYGDSQMKEEFFWAAAELYCTTGEGHYYELIRPELGKITFRLEESWRNYVDNIGYYSLYLSDRLSAEDRELLETGIVELAEAISEMAASNPYGIPVNRFVWGSNSDVLNTAIVQLFAYDITLDKKFLNAAVAFTDYIFGRNATAYSFVSGYGSKYSENFHHRLLMADDNEEVFPGFVAGGPNMYMQDGRNLEAQGVEYPSDYPAKAYVDHPGSYASNEICINWNAPLVFVLTALENL